ncbi:MAG: CBS domain-containing protein [Lachnospiraceae bacterium]|nr:CBS domain-containing protein [Lachnospiraceae bacterium]
MNILFYLLPKSDVVYVYDDFTLRQAMDQIEAGRYSAVPIISRAGGYVGTLTEGDLLSEIRHHGMAALHGMDGLRVGSMKRRWDNQPVNINCEIEDLIQSSMNQNFVPVVDDNQIFIGIVTRKSIIEYFYNRYKTLV